MSNDLIKTKYSLLIYVEDSSVRPEDLHEGDIDPFSLIP